MSRPESSRHTPAGRPQKLDATVESVLARRAERGDRRRAVTAFVVALIFHVGLAVIVIFMPQWLHKEPPPMKFVSVQIVPLQALGVEDAPNTPRPRSRPEPPPPQREPPPTEPPPPAVTPPPPSPAPPTQQEPRTVDPDLPTLATTPEKPRQTPPASPPPPPPQDISTPTRPADVVTQGSATGDVRGTSGFGGGSVSFDKEFTYGYYIDRMLASLRPHWKRPPVQAEIEAEVYFRIARNGEVSEVRLVSSSGYTPFDQAAEQAVRDASPLPPLPAGYRHPSLGVTLVVR